MNEWLKKFSASAKERWAKWSVVQRIILIAIVVAVIVAIIFAGKFSAKPTTVPLFNAAITDQATLDNILFRLDEGNVKATSANGFVYVDDERTARKWRATLLSEDLVPGSMDAWSLFDTTSWSTTDFERNVNLQRSVTRMVKEHIESLDDVASADVVITPKKDAVFREDAEPAKASVILTFRPGANIAAGSKKVQGIQNILLRAIAGMVSADNVIITDSNGTVLNDFDSLAEMERLTVIQKQQKEIARLETELRAKVLSALRRTFSDDRVRDLNVNLQMDMSEVTREQTIHTPFERKARTPGLPYDDSEYVDSVALATQAIDKEFTGTGYNPEGPAGVEGQNPPVMSDMSNMIGKTTERATTTNYAINTERRVTVVSPEQGRRTVSVNIDGKWRVVYGKGHVPVLNEDGTGIERKYEPLSEDDLENARSLIRDAIGYEATRGDSVTVTNIMFDREAEFEAKDDAYFAKQRRNRTIMITLVGVAAILVAFILFRFISRELERRRRLREEEMLRRQQAEREKALWDARQEGMEVTMSVEERKRAELLETAIAMSKEHPEDVAMLLRTWMMEE